MASLGGVLGGEVSYISHWAREKNFFGEKILEEFKNLIFGLEIEIHIFPKKLSKNWSIFSKKFSGTFDLRFDLQILILSRH